MIQNLGWSAESSETCLPVSSACGAQAPRQADDAWKAQTKIFPNMASSFLACKNLQE